MSAHLIASNEARDKFILTDSGLLMTTNGLDYEEKDSYMVTIVMGRKGILRGKQAIQVKVSRQIQSTDAYFPIDNSAKNSIMLMMVSNFLGACY